MQPTLFENPSSLQSSNQSNKVVQPITQVLEEVIRTNQETKSQNSSPSIKKSLDELFREEGRSAKTIIGRPTLLNLLEYSRKNKNKIQALFIYRLDRISRITADYLAIRKKLAETGVMIISATEPTGDSPTEKLVE